MPNEDKDIKEKLTETKDTISENDHRIIDHRMQHRSGMPMMFAGIIVAVLLFIAIAAIAGNMFMRVRSGFINEPNNMTTFVHRGEQRMMGSRIFIENQSSTNTDITSGVVTSVNGTSFVISGNGNQYTVNTTGDTTYNTTDKKVSANDSVIVIGKITDKTIAATDVRIANF